MNEDNKYINIKDVAEAKGLTSTRSLRLELNKIESKYISREINVNGGTSYEILFSSLEPEIQQKLRDGEYIDLFRKSDLMITDSGSFILEWLPTEHPCMYLVNPRRNPKTYLDGFSTTARKALEKYYLCYNKKDIEKYFSLLMFDKQDPMKDERIKLKDEIFINIGSAGQKIVDYLTTLLTN